MLFLSIVLGEVLLPKLPYVLVDLLQVIFIQSIEGTEINQYPFEFNIVLQITILEIREAITISKITKHLIDVAIINRIIERLVVTAILCGKRVKILHCITDSYILDISNQGNITCLR